MSNGNPAPNGSVSMIRTVQAVAVVLISAGLAWVGSTVVDLRSDVAVLKSDSARIESRLIRLESAVFTRTGELAER